jgi:hypothetical protein
VVSSPDMFRPRPTLPAGNSASRLANGHRSARLTTRALDAWTRGCPGGPALASASPNRVSTRRSLAHRSDPPHQAASPFPLSLGTRWAARGRRDCGGRGGKGGRPSRSGRRSLARSRGGPPKGKKEGVTSVGSCSVSRNSSPPPADGLRGDRRWTPRERSRFNGYGPSPGSPWRTAGISSVTSRRREVTTITTTAGTCEQYRGRPWGRSRTSRSPYPSRLNSAKIEIV